MIKLIIHSDWTYIDLLLEKQYYHYVDTNGVCILVSGNWNGGRLLYEVNYEN